ncbi:MAG: hypothetical protein ABI809_00525 [Caldimonas sp.]
MLARLSSFVIWGLIAATAVFWALRLGVQAPAAPPHAVAVDDVATGSGDLVRLLGAPPVATPVAVAAPEASSRFRLLGIMAPRQAPADGSNHGGLALIAVDGKPPRAYPVGAHLDGDLVLQSVSLRTASIGSPAGTESLILEIPRMPVAAKGTLPPFGAPAPAAPVPPVPAQFNPPAQGAPGVPPPPGGAPPVPIQPGPVSVGGPQTQ